MGDFNIDLISGHDNSLNFMSETFMCSQIVTRPTRLYATLLDHIFININSNFHYETEILDAYWSDHQSPVQVQCQKNKPAAARSLS